MHSKYYCLITGASEGFGKALALECARRKMNLILVALAGPELNNLAMFIKRNYKVDIIAIEKDLSKAENCIALFNELSDLNVKINMLINNVGLGSTMSFCDGSIQLYQKQISLNIMATTLITRLFVPLLEKNSPAHILNVGSLSCFFFLAKKQVYGGTKSYIYFFSKSLRREL
ncbi:MAG: SDR family NAD(P)-dependent oxidoreductase, partial [Flavobacterium sp.]